MKRGIVFALCVLASLPAVTAHGIHDYSIAYFENGTVTYENSGHGTDENTVFELASNGKAVGAYVALKLVDEGKISLDSKIAPFLSPALLTDDARLSEVTLEQLLCHTAGFSPSFELGVDKKLYSAPGERFRYSGVGYIYVQDVIEAVSGMTMEQAARHYVFEPLGMGASSFERARTVTPYMHLSSAVLYALAGFAIAYGVLFLIALIVGRMTRFRLYTVRRGSAVCFVAAVCCNTVFLLCAFVSKVAVLFWGYAALTGLFLLIAKKTRRLFYAVVPASVVLTVALGLALPVSIPVTNDVVAKKANCAYTLTSTSKDMALFCRELMRNHDGGGTMGAMFSDAARIDSANGWGLGIAIESEPGGNTYWHSGINPGFQSLFVLYPGRGGSWSSLPTATTACLLQRSGRRNFWALPGGGTLRGIPFL